jgi:hypothetical protein
MRKFDIVWFVVIFVFLYTIILCAIYPIKKSIDYCETNNWNGSEYDTGVILFRENKSKILKCNKTDDTDNIVAFVNSIYFWEDLI